MVIYFQPGNGGVDRYVGWQAGKGKGDGGDDEGQMVGVSAHSLTQSLNHPTTHSPLLTASQKEKAKTRPRPRYDRVHYTPHNDETRRNDGMTGETKTVGKRRTEMDHPPEIVYEERREETKKKTFNKYLLLSCLSLFFIFCSPSLLGRQLSSLSISIHDPRQPPQLGGYCIERKQPSKYMGHGGFLSRLTTS